MKPRLVHRGKGRSPTTMDALMLLATGTAPVESRPWTGREPLRLMIFFDGDYLQLWLRWLRHTTGRDFDFTRLLTLLEHFCLTETDLGAEAVSTEGARFYSLRDPSREEFMRKAIRMLSCGVVAKSDWKQERLFLTDQQLQPFLEDAGIEPWFVRSGGIEKLAPRIELVQHLLHLGRQDAYDLAVLVSGNGSYVRPLRRVRFELRKLTVVAHFDVPQWKDSSGRPRWGAGYSRRLNEEANWSLNLSNRSSIHDS
jgi:hypothetical protein